MLEEVGAYDGSGYVSDDEWPRQFPSQTKIQLDGPDAVCCDTCAVRCVELNDVFVVFRVEFSFVVRWRK